MPHSEDSTDPAQALLIHDGFVRALARSLLVDRDAADDVAQDTWVAALERGAAAVSLPRWLAGVVRNRAGKHARSEGRRQQRERAVARGEGAPSDQEILEREAVRARVVAAVLLLEGPYRECVLLRFYENLPPRAIAARLGVPVETVRTRLKRALEMLRARLDREHGGGRAAWSAALLSWAEGGGVATGPALVTTLAGGAAVLVLATWLALRDGSGEPTQAGASGRSAALEPAPARAAAIPAGTPAEREPVSVPSVQPLVTDTGTLRATVRWSDGTPAEGIEARCESFAVESPRFRARRARTDEQGELFLTDLPPGRATLVLDRGGAWRVEIEAGVESELALTLARGFDVEGLVVDRTGAPVAAAELWLSEPDDFTGAFVGTTDAQGRFALRSCVRGQELGAFAAGHAPSLLASLNAEEGARLELRLVLPGEGGEVTGVVRDPRGEPLAGAQVLVGSELHEFRRVAVPGEGELVGTVAPPRLVRTDEEGRFSVGGVAPGRVPIVVRAEGCARWRAEFTLAPAEVLRVHVELAPEASVAGCVRDAQGAPLARAWVRLAGRTGQLDPEITTGADGLYRLGGLAAGENVLEAQVHEVGRASAGLVLVAGEERAWDPVVGLGAELRGRVLDEGGAPLSFWSLLAVQEGSDERPCFGSAFSDEDGRFRIRSLTQGSYRLTLEAPGASVDVLELGGVRPDSGELVLRVPAARMPSARVRGRILDARGAVPGNVGLELATANLGMPGEVGADGSFELGRLVPALYTLRVRAEGHVEHVFGPRRLAAGESWELGQLVLEPAATLVVRAQLPEGTRVSPWFRVHRRSDDGHFDLGPLEPRDGTWRREALAPGAYVLETGGHLVAASLLPLELAAGETRTLEVVLAAGHPRTIDVRTPTDLGLARVHLCVWTGTGELLSEAELIPMAPGAYRHSASYAPGNYRVVAELADGRSVTGELRVSAEEFAPLALELR